MTAYAELVEYARKDNVHIPELAHQKLWISSKFFQSENILFVYACYGWANDLMNSEKIRFIMENFVVTGSKYEINIDARLRRSLLGTFGYQHGSFLGGTIAYHTAVSQGLPLLAKASKECHNLAASNAKTKQKQIDDFKTEHATGQSLSHRYVVRPTWMRVATLGAMSKIAKKRARFSYGLGMAAQGIADMKPLFANDKWFRRLAWLAENAK